MVVRKAPLVVIGFVVCAALASAADQPPGRIRAPGLSGDCPPFPDVNWSRTSVGLTPLTDLGAGFYQGRQGGLYPGGSNLRPPLHEEAGVALARAIGPLDPNGVPDPGGRYVLLSIGISNTKFIFDTFKPLGDADPAKDPRLVIVNGADPGAGLDRVTPDSPYWSVVAQRLANAGVTSNQVAVVWIKMRALRGAFPGDAQELTATLTTLVQILHDKFPNLRLAYLASRGYAGYSTDTKNPEPFSYETGFSVKWLIENQINGDAGLNFDPARDAVRAPWLAWGPYYWADGLTPRSDGLTWPCEDFIRSDGGDTDGIHYGNTGRAKIAAMLLNFFKTDATAREWFLASPPTGGSHTSVSAASFSGAALAAEAIAASFGSNLATTMQSATVSPLPTTLAGTSVKVRDSAGSERLAPLFFVSPTQVNYQIPAGTTTGSATITVTSGAGSVSTGNAQIAAVAPGLFTADASGRGLAAAVALRIKADGSQQFEPVARFDPSQNKFVAVPIDLGPESDQVFLILFGTGIRYRSSLSAAAATIGGPNGVDAQVTFAGAQGGFAGLDQVNVRLSRSLIGRGEVDVALTVDGQAANTVKVCIK